jgi:class 3 adenylate cyclase
VVAQKEQLHERLRQVLPSAETEASYAAATFLDVRGFSSFAARSESFDVAHYLRAIYSRILEEYFDDYEFFKPTGDGLLLVHALPSTSSGIAATLSSLVERSLRLVEAFPRLADGDVMITAAVPANLGIGIARGPVSRLIAGGLVLDYTGHCLNVAARLMDKARPKGVVLFDVHASTLLAPEVAAQMTEDSIFLRGVSTDLSPVWVSQDVVIEPTDRTAPTTSRMTWGDTSPMPVGQVLGHDTFGFELPRLPRASEHAGVVAQCPAYHAGKRQPYVRTVTLVGRAKESPSGCVVYAPLNELHELLGEVPESKRSGWLADSVRFTPFCAESEASETDL